MKRQTLWIIVIAVGVYLVWHYMQAHQGQGVGGMAGRGKGQGKQPASQMTG